MALDWSYFDKLIDRAGTACEKWDACEEVFGSTDVIPLWVADMDFPCAPEIVSALERRAAHPIYGYTQNVSENRAAEAAWLHRRFGIETDPNWLLFSPSVVDSMLFTLCAFTLPGERVLIQTPVYGPFRETIARTGRTVVESPLLNTPEGWKMDLDGVEAAFQSGIRFMFICSPHNPIGRVWTRKELEALFALAESYGVLIVSDEIHASFVFAPHVHTSALALSRNVIVLTSATKAFNLAGLRQSSVVVPNDELRKKLMETMHLSNADHPNLFGMIAQRAAYEHGDAWLNLCVRYIRENRDFAYDFLQTHLPEVTLHPLEGTYLMWLDMRKTGIPHKELYRRLIEIGHVGLNDGLSFGKAGEGFFRLNLATQRINIEKGLQGIQKALQNK